MVTEMQRVIHETKVLLASTQSPQPCSASSSPFELFVLQYLQQIYCNMICFICLELRQQNKTQWEWDVILKFNWRCVNGFKGYKQIEQDADNSIKQPREICFDTIPFNCSDKNTTNVRCIGYKREDKHKWIQTLPKIKTYY